MLGNIIDHRTNTLCVDVDAVFEPSRHDNKCKGASQFPRETTFVYHELYNTTIEGACKWAMEQGCYTTIYLYDSGSRPGDRMRTEQDTPA